MTNDEIMRQYGLSIEEYNANYRLLNGSWVKFHNVPVDKFTGWEIIASYPEDNTVLVKRKVMREVVPKVTIICPVVYGHHIIHDEPEAESE